MKRYLLSLLLILAALLLWSVKAEQILKSPDVIAYEMDGQAYLMDVNTGNEVKIKTSTKTHTMLWDKSGEHLYRTYVNQDIDKTPMVTKVILYNISLPDLKETQLMETNIADDDVIGIKLVWGKNGNLYIIKKDSWGGDDIRKRISETTCGYYSFLLSGYYQLDENEAVIPDIWIDPLHQTEKMNGFDLVNKFCEDKVMGNHYELFAHKQVEVNDENKVNWTQLSKFLNLENYRIMHLHKTKKLDYRLSPDHKSVLVSYPYYISDDKTTIYNSFLYSIEPANCQYQTVTKELFDDENKESVTTRYNELQTQIKMEAGCYSDINDDYWYEWTKDGRLIYSKEESLVSDKMVIGVSSLLMLDKTLKTYKGDLPVRLHYRYIP